MNKLFKIILGLLGMGVASAAGYDAITPADTTIAKVQTAFEQSALKGKYKMENSKFVKEGADKNKVKTEVGEAGKAEFEPSLSFSRWDGQSKFKVKPDISGVAKKNKKVEIDGEKIKYKTGKVDYVFYDLPTASEEGGFEFEIVLNQKPARNIFVLPIETQGLEFYPQPPLNEEAQEEGLTCTATECKDADGDVVISRPENIVDSIAVYSNGKAGNYEAMGGYNYMAGKVAHIDRIKMVDANGASEWCKQGIGSGFWTITCPQSFLNSAVYPVVVDPTFGYTTAPTASYTNLGGNAVFAKGTPANNGSVDSISFYGKSSSPGNGGYVKGVIWLVSDLSIIANSIAPPVEFTPYGELKWFTSNYSTKPSVIGNTDYYVGGIISANSVLRFYYDSGSSGDGGVDANNYSNPTSLSEPFNVDSKKGGAYATYTASGGASRRIIITE